MVKEYKVSWLESRFYILARGCIFVLTLVALGTCLMLGGFGLQKLTAQADEKFRNPHVTYADFQNSVASQPKPIAQASEESDLNEQEKSAQDQTIRIAFERRFLPYRTKIMAALTTYSEALGMAKPSADAVGDFVHSQMRIVEHYKGEAMAWEFVENMQKAIESLAADSPRLAKLPKSDPARVRWDRFLTFYCEQYAQSLQTEDNRIESERSRVVADRASSWLTLSIAGGALIAFVFSTMLLILFRVERNTRHIAMISSTVFPHVS